MMVKRQLQRMSKVPRELGLETKLVVLLGVEQFVSHLVAAMQQLPEKGSQAERT